MIETTSETTSEIQMTGNMVQRLFPEGLAGKHIHAVGGGGIGISTVMQLAKARGAIVTGCDQAKTSMWPVLNQHGISLTLDHDPAHVTQSVPPVDLVVTAPAVMALNPNNPEIAAAHERDIPVMDWQELLDYFMIGKLGVAVAGVHGKGTTTAFLAQLAITGSLDPTVEIGAIMPEWGTNVRSGMGPHFIIEADEWNYNFLHYHPRVVVLTAIEYDHPEFFPNYEAIRDAFMQFIAGMQMGDLPGAPPPTLVLNADDPGCQQVRQMLGATWPGEIRTFGITAPQAQVRGTSIIEGRETSFDLHVMGQRLGRVTLTMPGKHNVYNALAATVAAQVLGVRQDVLVPALGAFQGVKRRFEISDGARDITYVDDYAHHPSAVKQTLRTTRLCFPGRRIVAVFQPTLFSRLEKFLTPFSEAFDDADVVAIVKIQPSRQKAADYTIRSQNLVDEIQKRPVFQSHPADVISSGEYDETVIALRPLLRDKDVLVVMGSGPVNHVIPPLRDA